MRRKGDCEMACMLCEGAGVYMNQKGRLEFCDCEISNQVNYLVIVNGRHTVFNKDLLSYENALDLAGFKPGVYTVTYSVKNGNKGSLTAGLYVDVIDGLVINVSQTDNA